MTGDAMPPPRKAGRPSQAGAPLVELAGVSKRFMRPLGVAARIGNLFGAHVRAETIVALDHVDLTVLEGEVVGVVGESGSGKSTLGRVAVGLVPPTAGERYWRGAPLARLAPDRAREQRRKMQMVFADPDAPLDPRRRVVDIVGEAPVVHRLIRAKAKIEYVGFQLNRVGLDPTLMRRFPHQFSAGQRARIGIARALAVKPEFLVCDEPVAALDVTIRAQLLNVLMDLRSALNLSWLFLSRDPAVVEHVSDRVVVMYLGRIVETGPTAALFAAPNHPYTQALLTAIDGSERQKRRVVPIGTEIPSALDPPPGCHFHPRCPRAIPTCRETPPMLREIAPGRYSACHLNEVR